MKTSHPTAAIKEDRVVLVMTPELKRRLFEVAAARGISASQFIREAVQKQTEGRA